MLRFCEAHFFLHSSVSFLYSSSVVVVNISNTTEGTAPKIYISVRFPVHSLLFGSWAYCSALTAVYLNQWTGCSRRAYLVTDFLNKSIPIEVVKARCQGRPEACLGTR